MVDLSKFKDLFVSESEEHLQKINDNLLLLEKKPEDTEVMNALMHSVHTLKGSSATMGYMELSKLSHVMEDLFDGGRQGKFVLDENAIDHIFTAVDKITEAIKSISKDNTEPSLDSEVKIIESVKNSVTSNSSSKGNVDTEPKNKVDVKKEVKETPVEEVLTHIKVPVERLDKLMDLMEELLIDKMRLEEIVGTLEGGGVYSKEVDSNLKAVTEHLGHLVSDIQYQTMQSRLVPVGQIFARFPRMVRDLSKKENKKIELKIEGDDLEFDRTIVDTLAEPLVHLLRNAVDHGITNAGVINLIAKREKDFAHIIVEDDGDGINWDRVKESAIEKGIATEQELASYTEEQIHDLIFHPQLSTNKVVTETSGRGVGMSVIKHFAESNGGRLLLKTPVTEKGGTRFTLELPLTLAIIEVLLVKIGGETFAIPYSNVERSVRVDSSRIKSLADQDVAVIDGVNTPLIELRRVFDFPFKEKQEDLSFKNGATIVVVRRGEESAGIVVDSLLEGQEIIVKPLSHILRGTKGLSGSTILGNGKVILILDTPGLLENPEKFIRTK